MISDKMRDAYDEYLNNHITAVSNAFGWLCDNLPEFVEKYDAEILGEIISKHDSSKYSDEEYFAYCEYFYGDGVTDELKMDFDLAWLHHQHNNPHHWQHWLLREDSGDTKALPMPDIYVIEMLCDHWAFSWVKNDLYEIFNWWDNNTEKIILHEDAKKLYENILSKIRSKLDEQESDVN